MTGSAEIGLFALFVENEIVTQAESLFPADHDNNNNLKFRSRVPVQSYTRAKKHE